MEIIENYYPMELVLVGSYKINWERKYLYHYNLGDTNYKQNKPIFVRESLNKVHDFTKSYLSAKHHLFISGKSVYFPDTLNPLEKENPYKNYYLS